MENSEVGEQLESRAKTNVLIVPEQCCSCGKWQEYKDPCSHAVAYLRKCRDLSSKNFTESCPPMVGVPVQELQVIYENNIFPAAQDQMWYDSITKAPVK